MRHGIIYLVLTTFTCFTFFHIGSAQNTTVSQNADEMQIRELTRRFYYEFEKPTLDDQLTLWSPRSTDDSSNKERVPRVRAQWDKVKVEKFNIDRVQIEGETATVRLTVHVSAVGKKSGKPLGGWLNREAKLTHKLVKENGKWLLLWQIGTAEDFAAEVLKAKTDQERDALLAANKGLIDREFINELGGRTLDLGLNDFDYPRALKGLSLTLRLAEELKDKEMIAQTVSFLAVIYSNLGDHGLALISDQRYLQLLEELGDAAGASNARNSIGVDYAILGDFERALDSYQKSLETKLPYPSPVREAEGSGRRLGNIGQAYLNLGDSAGARESFEKLYRISETGNFRTGLSTALVGFGDVYKVEGNYRSALDSYLKALQLNSESKDKGANQYLLKKIGEIHRLLEQYPEALKYAEDAARIAEEIGIKDLGWDARVTAGKAYMALGQLGKARFAFADAIDTIEKMRIRFLGGEEAQHRFFEDKSAPYNAMVDLLVFEKKDDEAFTVAEKTKARILLNLLTGGRNTVTKSMTDGEKREEMKLRARLAEANKLLNEENQKPQADPKRLAELKDQLNQARLEHETFRSKLYLDHPELRVQRGEMKPITIEETASLMPNTTSAIAEFVVAEDRTFLFVITKEVSGKASLKIFPIDVGKKELTQRVETFRSKSATGDIDFQKSARELYDLLLKPAQAQLSKKINLIIVPDGPLWDLPFQALRNEKNMYLIEQMSISYAPSLTALREMSRKRPERNPDSKLELLAFGNPIVKPETSARLKQVMMGESLGPLPESGRLVRELGKMYGADRSEVFTGERAREETAKTESPKFRIVQFATHGILNNILPMYSHLVLSQDEKNPNEDGLLEAWEMKDLDLQAEMVILTACETGRGRISNGEGVIGMSWAIFIAGAPTTVASQWKVESSSTTELMLEFHRQLLSGKGTSKAEALRQASLKLLKSRRYQHPSYWAGFVIVGDGN